MLLTGLAGCTELKQWKHNGYKVGPNYRRPCASTSVSWIDGANPNVVMTSQENADWWRIFNDPALEELVQTAYQQNLSLRAAGLRVLQARKIREIATLSLLPQSQAASGGYSRNQISENAPNFFPGTNTSFSNWSTGFDMSWELDVWGRIRRSIDAADAGFEAEINSYDAILVTLVGDVAATYIEVRAIDQRLNLAEKNAELQKSSLDLTEKRNAEGAVSALDVAQAKANYTDTLSLIPLLRQSRRIAVNRLSVLLGMTPFELEPLIRERGAMPIAPEQAVTGIPNELLRRRPDIRAAERLVAVQSEKIGIVKADLYPRFGLSGEIGVGAEHFNDLFSSGSQFATIAPGFRWNILHYGRLKKAVEIEQVKFQESVVNYQNSVLAAHQEVEDALTSFLESKERLNFLTQSADAVQEAVNTVRLQYEEGATDFGRVFVLESALVQRQDELTSVKAEVSISLVRLFKSLGGGWQFRLSTPYTGSYPLTPIVPMQSPPLSPEKTGEAIGEPSASDNSDTEPVLPGQEKSDTP